MTTTVTVTTNMITVNLSQAAIYETPELIAEVDALRPEMPDASLEQILSKIVTKRIVDHLSALAS